MKLLDRYVLVLFIKNYLISLMVLIGMYVVMDMVLRFNDIVSVGKQAGATGLASVWVTLEGHLASKDGYATFDPTEFKVGDLEVPVSLVNDALQKKLGEQRDKLKLPDNVGGFKVENGEIVLTQR